MASPQSVSGLESGVLPPRWQTAARWGAPGVTLLALAVVLWNCLVNPKIHFLPPGPAPWIVYPQAPDLGTYPALHLVGTFERAFVLPEKPATAALSWRCLTNGEIWINGTIVPRPESLAPNWKTISRTDVDVVNLLRAGTNDLMVTVENRGGPPALSLELRCGGFMLVSDATWHVSVSGSDWQSAQDAPADPKPERGNQLAVLETTAGALRSCGPWLCIFVAMAAAGTLLFRKASHKILLTILGAAWLVLFLHNLPLIPAGAGFDGPLHLNYISYILHEHHLPDANEGSEMFQAPLYYLLGAALLGLAHLHASQPAGMELLRFLNLLIGGGTLAFAFAGLRLIFPGDWKKPLFGTAFAAFLPAEVYLLHFTTNETLSAMFVTAALYVGLRLLQMERPSPTGCIALGVVMGLGLLTKSSAILVVPLILMALAARLVLRKERTPQLWAQMILLPLAICLLIGGWHYLTLWREYGNPLIGDWDPKLGRHWWQYKGYQTPESYLSFGSSFTHPFFGGLHSFWDGFYSTLWGDGYWGGRSEYWSRIPWNYNFMAVGFILALVPTFLVLTGLVRAIVGCFRAPGLPWLLLLAVGWLYAFAILSMSLKVPSYAHSKAFFGLSALLPFCALGALGFGFWAERGKVAQLLLGFGLALWLINVYASFWIKPHSVRTELAAAIAASSFNNIDPTDALLAALKEHPGDPEIIVQLADTEVKTNAQDAVARLQMALTDHPDNVQVESELGWDLGLAGHYDEALPHIHHAVELAPDDSVVAQTWSALANNHKDYPETVKAARHVLNLNLAHLQTHFNLAVALMNVGQDDEAARHFSALVEFDPTMAKAWFCRGLCELDQRKNWDAGIADIREAVRLDPANKSWQSVLERALKGPQQ
jgi:Flp pilus assembly protein TadD